MESLVDLICFSIKCRLGGNSSKLLLQLKQVPDELLVKIGAMPLVRPKLRWRNEYRLSRDVCVGLVTSPECDGYRYNKAIYLPLNLVAPVVFYARIFVDYFDTYNIDVRLSPCEGYHQYNFKQHEIWGTNPRIYLYDY